MRMEAIMNLVYPSVKRVILERWYLKSPPSMRFMMMYKLSSSWKAYIMLTMNLCLRVAKNYLSLRIESILLLVMTLQ